MGESFRTIASRRRGHRCLSLDGIEVPESSHTDTAAWNYPACDRRPPPRRTA